MTSTRSGAPRVALWGAGVMAGAHAAACHALGWPIVGVASRSAAHAGELADRLGTSPMTYAQLADADGIDLAVIGTPPSDHLDAARVWVGRGVPTVLSTPLADTLADADELVALDVDGAPPMLFGSNLSVAPAVQALFGRVGRAGTLTSMSGRSIRRPPTWGEFTGGGWGGGVLLHPGVHQITLMLLIGRLAGLGAAASVSARLEPNHTGAVDDHAEIEIRFSGGLVAHATVSWRGAAASSWDLQLASEHTVLRLDMDGTPHLEHNGEPVATPLPRSTPNDVIGLAEIGLIAQLDAFWTGCRAGRRPVMNMAFGREVLDLTAAGYVSGGRHGEPVALPFAGPRTMTPLQLWRHPHHESRQRASQTDLSG